MPGRGPTIDMSPFRTLISCGNSSSFNLLSQNPILVTSGSPLKISLSTFLGLSVIVRNLKTTNGFPFSPALSCLNSTGPFESIFIKIPTKASKGSRIKRRIPEKRKSKLRFIVFRYNINVFKLRIFWHYPDQIRGKLLMHFGLTIDAQRLLEITVE